MKHRFKNLGALTVAVFALLAIGAQLASASQPEFSSESGKFGFTFSGTGGAGVLETKGGETVNCTANSNEKGEVLNKTETRKSVVKFTGCKAFGIAPCTSTGQASGTIVTVPLKGKLVFGIEEGVGDVPSVLLEPESGTTFASFKCTFIGIGATLTVRGNKGVLGEITPVNGAFSKTLTLTFNQTKGVQKSGHAYRNPIGCGEVGATLETESAGTPSFAFEQSGIQGSATLTSGTAIKVVAGSKCE